jgi:hypothetical protein
LVKVLDSKDIILEIERIAPDLHYLLGIDLGMSHASRQQSQQQRQATAYRPNPLHNCVYNGKSRPKFRNRQKTPVLSPFFHILWLKILKTAKGFCHVSQ